MPVKRIPIRSSQLAELIGIEDPARIRNIVRDEVKREGEARDPHRWWIVVEPEES
jgi:tetrahydromethanopterin S-methyltransferase subunit A